MTLFNESLGRKEQRVNLYSPIRLFVMRAYKPYVDQDHRERKMFPQRNQGPMSREGWGPRIRGVSVLGHSPPRTWSVDQPMDCLSGDGRQNLVQQRSGTTRVRDTSLSSLNFFVITYHHILVLLSLTHCCYTRPPGRPPPSGTPFRLTLSPPSRRSVFLVEIPSEFQSLEGVPNGQGSPVNGDQGRARRNVILIAHKDKETEGWPDLRDTEDTEGLGPNVVHESFTNTSSTSQSSGWTSRRRPSHTPPPHPSRSVTVPSGDTHRSRHRNRVPSQTVTPRVRV